MTSNWSCPVCQSLWFSLGLPHFSLCTSFPSCTVLARQIDSSHCTSVVWLFLFAIFILFESISCPRILHCGIWSGNLLVEQFYRLLISIGWSQRATRFAYHGRRGKGIPTICSTAAGIQILVGMCTGDGNVNSNDFLFGIWCSRLLADSFDVLLHFVFHDDEETNHAHVQASVCAN